MSLYNLFLISSTVLGTWSLHVHAEELCPSSNPQGCHSKAREAEARKDWNTASRLYQRACDAELAKSCNNLGLMLAELGEVDAAITAFEWACRQNHPSACQSAFTFASRHNRVDQAAWFAERLCDQGSEQAVCSSGSNSQSASPKSTGVDHQKLASAAQPKTIQQPRTEAEARNFCAHDSIENCIEIAKKQEAAGEFSFAIELYLLACTRRETFGCVQAAHLYRKVENPEGARLALQQACKHSDEAECQRLRENACRLGHGWHCPADRRSAH